MEKLAEEKESLREQVLEACFDEYKELIAIWRNIDIKAQGNITVAGIFIAGAFTYLSKISQKPEDYEQVLFVLAIMFLVFSVILSILVLWIRNSPHPPLGDLLVPVAKRMLDLDDETFHEYWVEVFYTRVDAWTSARHLLRSSNETKGHLLWTAQMFLVIAILWAASLFVAKILLW
jgi:hypothetical protein